MKILCEESGVAWLFSSNKSGKICNNVGQKNMCKKISLIITIWSVSYKVTGS